MPDAQLEARRLATRQPAQLGDELHHTDRRGKGPVPRGRYAILAPVHASNFGDLARHLGGRQNAAEARFGTLTELDLDHLDLGGRHRLGKALGRKTSVRIAAAKVAGADFPNQVTAVLQMVRAETSLTGVVGKAA